MKIGLFGILGVIFVTLKLCGVIGWSWWWVICPFWIGAAVVFGGLLLVAGGLWLRTLCQE